jgi:hypothetical protein
MFKEFHSLSSALLGNWQARQSQVSSRVARNRIQQFAIVRRLLEASRGRTADARQSITILQSL